MLAHNLPVHSEGRTLGEFDCLYRCLESGRTVHLELAVKFFLRSPAINGLDTDRRHWLGPDTRDRLDLKIDHLLHHQIHLSHTTAAQETLAANGLTVTDREIALRGCLFTTSDGAAAPEGFNDDVVLQRWARVDSWQDLVAGGSSERYLALEKSRWLSPAIALEGDALLDAPAMHARLQAHFADTHYPVLLAAMDARGVETARFFVTTDDWPNVQATPGTT